jgi:hypothetical protein
MQEETRSGDPAADSLRTALDQDLADRIGAPALVLALAGRPRLARPSWTPRPPPRGAAAERPAFPELLHAMAEPVR